MKFSEALMILQLQKPAVSFAFTCIHKVIKWVGAVKFAEPFHDFTTTFTATEARDKFSVHKYS